MDGRLLINAAAFFIDWSKQQLTTNFFFPNGTTASYLVNAGTTKVEGLEFELNGVVNEYFSTGFAYNLNDAEFTEFFDTEHQQLFGGDGNAKGKQTPNSSKHQFQMNARFSYPVGDEISAYMRADFAFKERKYAQIYNLAHTGDQKLLNLKFGVESEAWNVTLFIDNVTNDKTPPTVIRFVDFKNPLPIGTSRRTATTVRGFQVPLARLRQFGLTANYAF
jgi:iron complex outermembrane receptor protein